MFAMGNVSAACFMEGEGNAWFKAVLSETSGEEGPSRAAR